MVSMMIKLEENDYKVTLFWHRLSMMTKLMTPDVQGKKHQTQVQKPKLIHSVWTNMNLSLLLNSIYI